MPPGENEQPATVTDTDRAKARRYWLDARYADDVDGPEEVIAQAIADARAPFLVLADRLERGHWRDGQSYADAIRRAAEADQ